MSKQPLAPDGFAVGLLLLGVVLLLFPAMRVAGVVALGLAVSYWVLMSLLKSLRR
jgi:hypothetical protein